jgi:hypothetical protein
VTTAARFIEKTFARSAFLRRRWIAPLLILLMAGAPMLASPAQFQKAVVTRVNKSQPTLPYRNPGAGYLRRPPNSIRGIPEVAASDTGDEDAR